MKYSRSFRGICLVFFGLTYIGCGKKKVKVTPMNMALVKPPVEESTPEGLSSSSSLFLADGFSDLKSRFYTKGPTSVSGILADIDGRLNGINSRSKDNAYDCVSQAPIAYSFKVAGEEVTMYAQCYEHISTPDNKTTSFGQFAIKDGVNYVFYSVGAGNMAAIATPSKTKEGKYKIQAWLSVGLTNSPSWSAMSYGVIKLLANSETKSLEVAVAGVGFGYCGAQLKSDGTKLFFTNSADMGAICGVSSDLCALAKDLTTANRCDALQTFEIPGIGRKATTDAANTIAASLYPTTSPNVTLDGTATDDVHFGPVKPTDGVGEFKAASSSK